MSNKSILQFPNKQQFIVTLPKGLVLAKGWKQGDKLEFIINNKGEIVIKKCKIR
jgi:bifunctional DNA-binding transcriptional regulator/antitoxin component of YhaV-PrlF toxin-antitoxin module